MGYFRDWLMKITKPFRPTLLQDIASYSEWIAKTLGERGYVLDFTVDSMKEVDRFFDEQGVPGGEIEKNRGQILFALGAYIGQTVIRTHGGEWVTDDNDPKGELEIAVKLPNGFWMWPVQKCLKRCRFGAEDSIASYVRAIDRLE